MALPYIALAALAGGTALRIFGAQSAAREKRNAALINKQFFQEQQRLTELEIDRNIDIFETQSELTIGKAVDMFAQTGTAFNSNVAAFFGREALKVEREKEFIRLAGESRIRLAGLRANQQQRMADFATVEANYNSAAAVFDAASLGLSKGIQKLFTSGNGGSAQKTASVDLSLLTTPTELANEKFRNV